MSEQEKQSILLQVSEAVKAARESAGLTLCQLQELNGIREARLRTLFSGIANPTLYIPCRIADELGQSLVVTLTEK